MPDDFIKNQNGINIKNPTSDQDVNAQKIKKYIDALNRAKAKIKQDFIASDKSNDKSVTFAAMTQFKEKNG